MNIDSEKLKELERTYLKNFRIYAKDNLKIQNTKFQLVPFAFNIIQLILHVIINDIKKNGRLVRCYILKARREGVSTYLAGRAYWKTTKRFNYYSMIIAHEPEATDFLFNMIKRFQQHNEFKPSERYNNKKMLDFNNETGTGLDSAMRTATAGKEDIGSAQLIHFLWLSELSKFPPHITSSLLTSLFQCVPDNLDSEIFIESTAKGIGGEFHDGFWNCRYNYEVYLDEDYQVRYKMTINKDTDENNQFSSIFIPWFVFSEYEKDVPADWKRTPEEEEMASKYNLIDRKLAWRRDVIANKCRGIVDLFYQEYPSNPREAFLSSGISCFNVHKVEELMKNAKPPVATYDVILMNGSFIFNKEGKFEVWYEPQKDRSYVVSADVAEGLNKKDFSSVDVIDQLTGIQVAHWHGSISPDSLAYLLVHIAKRYNMAMIIPERNNHGLITVTRLIDELKYPRVYVETVIESPNFPRKRYGWVTTKTNKFPIIDNLASEINNDTHGINCKETFAEMLSFVQNEDGSLSGVGNKNDDRVMSIAIGKFVRLKIPVQFGAKTMPNQQYEVPAQASTEPQVSLSGWQ